MATYSAGFDEMRHILVYSGTNAGKVSLNSLVYADIVYLEWKVTKSCGTDFTPICRYKKLNPR